MAPSNEKLAREILRVLGDHDADGLIALADPQVEWHSFFALGEDDGAFRGHDGTRKYTRALTDAFEVAETAIDEVRSGGDVVVLLGRLLYRGRESGVQSSEPAGWLLEFSDGKLLRFRAFHEPEQALAAAGLAPRDA